MKKEIIDIGEKKLVEIIMPTLKGWEELEAMADDILAKATRDLVLWNKIKEQIKSEMKKCPTGTSKEEEKSTRFVKS